jgi:hypothetical protein
MEAAAGLMLGGMLSITENEALVDAEKPQVSLTVKTTCTVVHVKIEVFVPKLFVQVKLVKSQASVAIAPPWLFNQAVMGAVSPVPSHCAD